MSFGNFGGNNAGSSGSTGSLFGAAKPATGGLFGAPASGTTSTETGGAFGGAAASTGSLFGNNSGSTTTGTSAPGMGLFGGGSTGSATTPAATSLFGSAPTSTTTGTSALGTTLGAPPTGGLFGASNTTTPTSTTPAPTSTNPLFGGFNKPADANASNAAKPTGTALSGQSSTPTGSTPAGGFFAQFAKTDSAPSGTTTAAPTTTSTSTTAPGAVSGSLFGGGLFGAKTPATQATGTTPSTSTPAPAAKGLDFFAKPAEKDATAAATPAASTTGGGLFGTKTVESKDAPAGGAPPLGGLFGKPAEKKDGTAPATSAPPSFGSTSVAPATSGPSAPTSLSVSVAPPSTLKGKTIEEIVNKWSSDLETHVREFNKFAGEVAVWDRALIENSNTLAALYSHVEAAERDQTDIDQSLNHIEQQQMELAAALVVHEKMAQEILGNQGGGMRALDTGPADTERDKNYMLATDLHTHLDDLSGSLSQMIESVNALSLPSIDSSPAEDPMAQIAQILSSHLESLQWIDGAVRDVEGKITEVEQRVKDNGHNLPSSGQKNNRTFGLNK